MPTINDGRSIGDRVGISDPKYPGVWIIQKRGPANTTLTPEGGGRGLRAPHYMLTDPPEVGPILPGGVPGSTVQAIPVAAAPTFYVLGEFVRITTGKYAGIWVVIADKGGDRVNLAKPGGDADRYLRMPRTLLSHVDASEVLK